MNLIRAIVMSWILLGFTITAASSNEPDQSKLIHPKFPLNVAPDLTVLSVEFGKFAPHHAPIETDDVSRTVFTPCTSVDDSHCYWGFRVRVKSTRKKVRFSISDAFGKGDPVMQKQETPFNGYLYSSGWDIVQGFRIPGIVYKPTVFIEDEPVRSFRIPLARDFTRKSPSR